MADPPPYHGLNLPIGGASVDDADPPLVRLVKKLYSCPQSGDAAVPRDPTLFDDVALLHMAHDDAILREPWSNAEGVSTRACLVGDSCVGKHASLPGHEASGGGVVLTEFMTPKELAEFEGLGKLPLQRRTCLLCARYNIHAAYLYARKQRSFPANSLLNNFVNAAGEGEYSAEYIIPSPDDKSWSGICGTVVGLHLNALRLVQCPSRAWRVDQSAMAHVTRPTCNVTFPMLYRGVQPDPQAFLRDFFAHRTRVADAAVLFFNYDELCEARPKLGQPPTDAFMRWPEGATKSFAHRLLHYRVNRLNMMLQECQHLYGHEWAFNMQLYVDAHIGMVLLFERGEKLSAWTLKYTAYEHALPDFVPLGVQAAVNSFVPDASSSADRKRDVGKPRTLVVQMLLRALPEFAQTRSLHAAFIKCLQHRELSSSIFQLAQAALMGNYSHVTDRLPYATRKAMVEGFTQTTALGLFQGLPGNEHLILYIMRTYLLAALPLCPPLHTLVLAMSPINKQAARVQDALRVARATAAHDWTLMFQDSVLNALRKSHKRLPKRKLVARGPADCSSALMVNARRTAMRRGLKRERGVAFDPEFYQEQVKRARLSQPPPADMELRSRAAATAILEAVAQHPERRPQLVFSADQIDNDTLKQLSDFALAVDYARLARVTPFPQAFVLAQVQAVARRFNCAADDWTVLRRVSRVVMCTTCGVRNYYLTHAERGVANRRVDNPRAAGFRKLAFSMRLGELRCVGKASCSQYPLSTVDIAEMTPDGPRGGALVLRECALLISPCCGYLCEASALRVTPSGFDCPGCATKKKQEEEGAPDPRICAHCSKRSQLKMAVQQQVLLRDPEGRVKSYGFCRGHLRQWARVKSGYLTLDFVSRNMVNKTGAGLVLDPN